MPATEYTYFFVTGAHKSGTSWLAHLLRAHPAVAMPHHELWLFGHKHSIAGAGFDRLFADWLRLRCVALEAQETPLSTLEVGLRRRLVTGILQEYAGTRTRALGSKTPKFYALAHREINQTFPDSILIEIVRDPRDVIVSHHFHRLRARSFEHYENAADARAAYAYHIEGKGDPVPLLHPKLSQKFAKEWVEVVTACREASVEFGPRFVSVLYEDMLQDTELHLQTVFHALRLTASNRTLRDIVARKSFEALSGGRLPGENDPKSFHRKGIAGDWVNYFDEESTRMVESIAGELMEAFGYAKGRPPADAQGPSPSPRGNPTGLLARLGAGRWLRARRAAKPDGYGAVFRR